MAQLHWVFAVCKAMMRESAAKSFSLGDSAAEAAPLTDATENGGVEQEKAESEANTDDCPLDGDEGDNVD